MFESDLHTLALSQDGSFTAYSKEYEEHYHSTQDGALRESLHKHVLPAFSLKEDQKELHILDICFGLGFNTLATLYHHTQNGLNAKLYIYSPELDDSLVASLKNFTYPEEFTRFKHIIEALSEHKVYDDEHLHIELFVGDAREYIAKFHNTFDIVYHDPFSLKTNPVLWTLKYFAAIRRAIKHDAVITTYSTALRTRLALYGNNFNVYLYKSDGCRNSTLASLGELKGFEKVDMEHKISCNPDAKALRDHDVSS